VWEATKQAGGLNLIDVPTFVALSQFYNMNSNMLAQYAQLRDFSIAEILPRQTSGLRAHQAIPCRGDASFSDAVGVTADLALGSWTQ
jgi:hypothetical protein